MPHSLTLPALGAALLVAAGTGVHLGDSAIALIDPIHFQGPAIHPRDRGAAIDESEIAPSRAAFASYYGWEAGNEARAADCGNCDPFATRDAHSAHAIYDSHSADADDDYGPVRPAVEQRWEEPVRVHRGASGFIVEEAPAPAHEDEPAAERSDPIAIYASYPIEEETDRPAKPVKPGAYASYKD